MKTGKVLSLLVVPVVWLGAPSCVDNPAAYRGIVGTTDEPSEPAPSTGGAGAGGMGTAGTTAGTPANGTGGGIGEGGMGAAGDGGTGGSSAGSGTAGSATTTGGAAGTAGSGVAGAVNPPTHPDFSPACFLYTTVLGEEILKGASCTSADPQLCYRPCGPNQVGWKTETCTAGVYAEGDCTFPADGDYACYAVPDNPEDIDEATCGVTAPPAATDPCTAPLCMSCNFEGFYQDTGSNVKEGYCVCRTPDIGGVRRWSCASADAWPCPLNQGC